MLQLTKKADNMTLILALIFVWAIYLFIAYGQELFDEKNYTETKKYVC